jgi:thymidylate kinase
MKNRFAPQRLIMSKSQGLGNSPSVITYWGLRMEQKSLIVEIVGLPGVGKTTVSRLLSGCEKIRIEPTPYFREIKYAPFFAWNMLRSLPDFARIKANGDHQWLTGRDIALMAILKGWHAHLERQRSSSQEIILLDEGPVCYLTRMYAFGSKALKTESAKDWWDATCQQWARTLDLVIKLDTDDPILIERIRSREMPQIVKELSDPDALAYMRNHRAAQDYALNKILSQPVSPRLVEYSTTQKSPDQLFADLAGFLEL